MADKVFPFTEPQSTDTEDVKTNVASKSNTKIPSQLASYTNKPVFNRSDTKSENEFGECGNIEAVNTKFKERQQHARHHCYKERGEKNTPRDKSNTTTPRRKLLLVWLAATKKHLLPVLTWLDHCDVRVRALRGVTTTKVLPLVLTWLAH